MGVVAFLATGGQLGDPYGDVVFWGSAAAAAIAAAIVILNGPAFIAWAAIGYIVFAALAGDGPPRLLLLSLAVALTPVIPRPGGSLVRGLGTSALVVLFLVVVVPMLAV